MSDIFDYLKWRGDLSFEADPFNDVDNLVLAELSYTCFDGLVSDSGEEVPLTSVSESFFLTRDRDALMKSDDHMDRAPLLMDGMVSGDRYRCTMLSDYINIVDTEKDLQISAVVFHLSDGSAYISFRGTDNTVTGWKEDFNMSYMPETPGQRMAKEYLQRVASRIRKPLRVGGHSKGGNFAVYSSAFADPDIKDRILRIYTNDGPGLREEVLKTPEYEEIVPKIRSIVPETSVIGMLLMSKARPAVVKSSLKGLAQHDALSWQVIRNEFEKTELSELGKFIRETQKDWLGKIDDEARRNFVDTVFSLFEATGMDTFGAMSDSMLKTVEKIIAAAQQLPREKQKQLVNIAAEFMRSGGQNVKTWYNRMLEYYEKNKTDKN